MTSFRAYMVDQVDGKFVAGVKEITMADLDEGNVLIRAHYSSVNFKDSLAAKEDGKIIRSYPMIPGIDVSGVVVESADPAFTSGDEILITGYDLGVQHTGGFSEYVRVKGDWLVRIPSGLSMKDVMKIGTAGFTAGCSIAALEKHGFDPKKNPTVLVTGATGGVGSIAIQILHKIGCKVHALSRKKEQESLQSLGADKVYTLDEITNHNTKPLAIQTYDYIIDTVGGEVVSSLIPFVRYGGAMTLCGNVAGVKLQTTVLPFILRHIALLGIDSVQVPHKEREEMWKRFATEWNIAQDVHAQEICLEQLDDIFSQLRAGTHIGRTIVKLY